MQKIQTNFFCKWDEYSISIFETEAVTIQFNSYNNVFSWLLLNAYEVKTTIMWTNAGP